MLFAQLRILPDAKSSFFFEKVHFSQQIEYPDFTYHCDRTLLRAKESRLELHIVEHQIGACQSLN